MSMGQRLRRKGIVVMLRTLYVLAPLAVILTGCATPPSWKHSNITDVVSMKRQLTIDDGNCTLIAMGAAPMPEIQQADGPKTTNFRATGSSFNPSTGTRTYGTYSGQATTLPSGGFAGGVASGMASGASLGTALAARAAQDKIYNSCMYSKGWFDANAQQGTDKPVKELQSVPAKAERASLPLAPEIYPSPKIEWEEDVKEFFQLYPTYSKSENYQLLDTRVRLIANRETLPGPQYLVRSMNELSFEGKTSGPAPSTSATALYLKAVSGDPLAQAGLGLAYAQGNEPPIPINPTRSSYWSRKAALQGNPAGQIGYGLMLFNGFAGETDRVRGYLWIKKAESQGANVSEILKSFRGKMTPAEIQSAGQ